MRDVRDSDSGHVASGECCLRETVGKSHWVQRFALPAYLRKQIAAKPGVLRKQ
jgi:hypothetical protein